MVKIMVDPVDPKDGPQEVDLDYDEMDPLMVGSLARSGDQGAVDFLNAQDNEDSPFSPSVSEPS